MEALLGSAQPFLEPAQLVEPMAWLSCWHYPTFTAFVEHSRKQQSHKASKIIIKEIQIKLYIIKSSGCWVGLLLSTGDSSAGRI